MAFTVTGPPGTRDVEFEHYLRLLRHRGVDLGKAPRVPDPTARRRWLYAWDAEAPARDFAAEVTEAVGDGEWRVVPTNVPASDGPFGPLILQLNRQPSGLRFSLHPLSLALLSSAHPRAFGPTRIFLDVEKWDEFQSTHGDFAALVGLLAPCLTGLTAEQLAELGYTVIDDHTQDTVLLVPPSAVLQV